MTQRLRRPARGPVRKMFWVRRRAVGALGALVLVDDMFTNFRLNMGILMNPAGLTIIRWIVSLSYRAVAVDDTVVSNICGIVVAPIDDPPPANALSNEFQRDWVLWSEQDYVQERQEGTPTQNLMKTVQWDIRSARKLSDPERTPFFVVESQDSDTQDYRYNASMLVKLP